MSGTDQIDYLVAANVTRRIEFENGDHALVLVSPEGQQNARFGDKLIAKVVIRFASGTESSDIFDYCISLINEKNSRGPERFVNFGKYYPGGQYTMRISTGKHNGAEFMFSAATWEEAYLKAHRFLADVISYVDYRIRERRYLREKGPGSELYLAWKSIDALSVNSQPVPLSAEERKKLLELASESLFDDDGSKNSG